LNTQVLGASSQGLQQRSRADDRHHALHVAGEHIERHLSGHFGQPLRKKVRPSHPALPRRWPPTQESFDSIAADLRKRALEVKKQDESLRKRDLEERDELKGFVEDANAELRCEPRSSQQQRQVLKGSQRAMKGSVGHIITVGLKDFQNRMLQTDFKVMTSVVPFQKLFTRASLAGKFPDPVRVVSTQKASVF
jgi:hypothetical protein